MSIFRGSLGRPKSDGCPAWGGRGAQKTPRGFGRCVRFCQKAPGAGSLFDSLISVIRVIRRPEVEDLTRPGPVAWRISFLNIDFFKCVKMVFKMLREVF